MQILTGSGQTEPDTGVAPARRWLIGAAILANGAALLATSPPSKFEYSFTKTVQGPDLELNASAPRAQFHVTARALELAPNERPTTESSSTTVQGTLTATQSGLFVRASVVDAASASSPRTSLDVLTDFRLGASPTFRGDCEQPGTGAAPCEASFDVIFERVDGGTGGGSVAVRWQMQFEAHVEKSDSSEGPRDLPWEIQVVPQ